MKYFLAGLFFITLFAQAAAPAWQIVSDKSSLSFTATQNDAPVAGSFKNFQGDIQFAPDALNDSHITIVVDMNSVQTSYQQVQDTLKAADWFNVKIFPQAVFKAEHISKLDDKNYQAVGTLTMRGKTVPVTLKFTLPEYTANSAKAIGSVVLQRTVFGVGQGEWANTKTIKDAVQIDFIITAVKK